MLLRVRPSKHTACPAPTTMPAMQLKRAVFCVLTGFAAIASIAAMQAQPSFDVLIQTGRVMDGSGNPWLRLDVGIRGGVVTAVGRLTGARATRVIDAADRIVAPGFIDVHSPAAEAMTRPALRQAQPLLAQGVT